MMKWLRDHTKQIMVVVVLLAMFSFVGAQGLQAILAPNPANEKIMRAFGSEYTQGDLIEADRDTQVLSNVFINWKPQGATQDFNLRHWFMLAEEAERAGVQVSDVAIESFIAEVDTMLAANGGIDSLRQSRNIGIPQIRHALQRNMAINQNASRVMETALPSEPQVRQYVLDTQDKVSVKMAVFSAENFVDEDKPVTEAELQAQFDAYRDVLPGESEAGFGYKFPDRVTIQYVVVEPGAIQSDLAVSSEEVIDYWKENKTKYTKNVKVPLPVDPTTTQPAEPTMITEKQQMQFSEARASIESELRNAKAKRVGRQAINRIVDAMAKPWSDQQRDTAGFLTIPSDAVRDPAYMQNIVNEVSGDLGVKLVYGEMALTSAEDLAASPVVGGAKLQGANESSPAIAIADMAFRVPAFFKPEGADSSEVRLQYFQPPPAPLRVDRNSFQIIDGRLAPMAELQKYVLFRVTDARESESPASLDDVRDRVVKDVKENKAYENMANVCREFGAASQILGTESALTLFDDLRTDRGIRTITRTPDFARKQQRRVNPNDPDDDGAIVQPAQVAGIGRSEKFIDACFEMAEDDWKSPIIEAPMNSQRVAAAQAQTPVTPVPKVRVIDLPKLRKRVVVEFVKHTPVDQAKYETELRINGYSDLMAARPVLREWFDTKRIEERCNYVDLRSTAEDPKTGIGSGSSDESEDAEA